MVQIDVPAAFAVGHFFADGAYKQLQSGSKESFYEVLLKHNFFQVFCFVWIPVYFMLQYFGWETTHMWWHRDSAADYAFFVPGFILIFFVAANAGFLLGTRLVRQGKLGLNRAIWVGIVAASALWILAQTGSTFRLGSYAEWKAGKAPWFYEDTTFVVMLTFVMVVWLSGLAYFFVTLRKQGKALP